jgi:hypothetical protein
MTLNEAEQVYGAIKSSRWDSLIDDLNAAAVRYARIRTDWQLADQDRRRALDDERSRAHDVFIDCCHILARNMEKFGEDASWHDRIGSDRKSIGDFACLIHCLLGLQAR